MYLCKEAINESRSFTLVKAKDSFDLLLGRGRMLMSKAEI